MEGIFSKNQNRWTWGFMEVRLLMKKVSQRLDHSNWSSLTFMACKYQRKSSLPGNGDPVYMNIYGNQVYLNINGSQVYLNINGSQVYLEIIWNPVYLERRSVTSSSWPPAQASVRAVSWLLSVSESRKGNQSIYHLNNLLKEIAQWINQLINRWKSKKPSIVNKSINICILKTKAESWLLPVWESGHSHQWINQSFD